MLSAVCEAARLHVTLRLLAQWKCEAQLEKLLDCWRNGTQKGKARIQTSNLSAQFYDLGHVAG
jgi:hypothetical protein